MHNYYAQHPTGIPPLHNSEGFRAEIEREVFEALQRDAEEQRAHRPTDWNRSANSKLKELLKRFEEDAAGVKKLSAGEHDAVRFY